MKGREPGEVICDRSIAFLGRSARVRVGPDLCWLAGALAASHSPASICHCAEALDPARPSPSHVQEKVPHAALPQSPSQARPEGTECRTHPCGCGNEATEPPLGLSANC